MDRAGGGEGELPRQDRPLGDAAAVPDLVKGEEGAVCPPTAQHATRQGAKVADNVIAAIRNQPMRPYRHKDLGLVVDLGGSVLIEACGEAVSGPWTSSVMVCSSSSIASSQTSALARRVSSRGPGMLLVQTNVER